MVAYFGKGALSAQLAAVIFALSCITDFLDGYLARMWNVQSTIGRILDPIADKLLVAALIIMLIAQNKMPLIPAIAIICREILVSGLREFLAELKKSVPVNKLAKFKTTVQMIALFLMLLGDIGSGLSWLPFIANIMIWIAAILTIITGYGYIKAGIAYVKSH
jgi:CDP-diacylglycerol--glycerol-3-phosphate 3-phosphatidyltransferase